jgi:hypothetical protein
MTLVIFSDRHGNVISGQTFPEGKSTPIEIPESAAVVIITSDPLAVVAAAPEGRGPAITAQDWRERMEGGR